MTRRVRLNSTHQSFYNFATATDNPLLNPHESYATTQHAPFINVKIDSNVFNVDAVGIVDTGSTVSLLPHHLLKEDQLKNLAPTDIRITGVTPGASPIVGKAIVDLTLDGTSHFKNIEIFVTKSAHPLLIGTNVLKHSSVTRFDMDFSNRKLIFHRHFNGPKSEEVELLKDAEAFKSIHKTHHAGQSLQTKMEWLKSKGILLPTSHPKEELEAITCLLYKYSDIIGTDDEDQGTFIRPVSLPTDGTSRSIPVNHVPQSMESEVDAEIQRMLDLGIIEYCPDPKGFNSPVYCVRKASGKIRVVANFKETLNRVLQDLDPYPMPTIDSLFNRIGNGNKYFATIDFKSGYWQIEIDPKDRHKTAFTWRGKCLQYCKLAFGLTCAGQIFSRCVAEALASVKTKESIVTYVDDNLVFAKTFKEFLFALEELFKALKSNGLKINPSKCTFIGHEAEFLGRVITSDGFKPNSKYVQGIMDMQPPTSKDENLKFVGKLTWIRQFLETRLCERVRSSSFSELMKPIHALNKSGIVFAWTPEADRAFKKIKKKLTTSPVISFPDFALPFSLTTDASDRACGAILMQEAANGKKRIVAVASKTFSQTEQNWSTTEREAFAIKWAIKKFDYFLNGRTFVVFTDHKSLVYLDRRRFNNAKISRWQEDMKAYKFVLQYIEGESNVWADMLSRSPGLKKFKVDEDPSPAGKFYTVRDSKIKVYIPSWVLKDIPEEKISITMDQDKVQSDHSFLVQAFTATGHRELENPKLSSSIYVAEEQSRDFFLGKVIQNLQKSQDGIQVDWKSILDPEDERTPIFLKIMEYLHLEPGTNLLLLRRPNGRTQMVIPTSLRPTFLHKAHEMLNHSGTKRTEQHLRDFWWPQKADDIKCYIDSCITCAKRKGNYGRRIKWNIGHCRRGTRPFEIIYVDFVHMPQSKGKRYILTMLDSYSRYFMAIPSARDRALDAARGLYLMFLRHRERPQIVSSDRGTHFTGEVYRNFCDFMGIKQELHCPWRPQSSGNIERQHRTMKNAIFMLCEERKCDWTEVLESVISNMNSMINRSTGVSPHFVVTGRHPNLGLPQKKSEQIRHPDPASYGMEINTLLNQTHKAVELANQEADFKMENRLNSIPTKNLEPGDKVLLYRPESAEAKSTHLPWLPGFTVVKSNGMVVKVKNDQNVTSWVHRMHLRFVPNRPPHLMPRTIVIPATSPNSPSSAPKPPFEERSRMRNVRSSASRIPRIQNRPIQIVQNNRRSLPIVQNRNQNAPVRRLRQSIAVPIRQPISRSNPSARPNPRPTRASLLRDRRISGQGIPNQIRRNPTRDRRLPSRFRDFKM